jgi:RNA polymerase sigma-70 factor, ECF subfamily
MSTHLTWQMINTEAAAGSSPQLTKQAAQVCAGSEPSLPFPSEVTALFDELRAPLLRYLWDFHLPSDTAEELVQEAFLKLFEELRQGRGVQMPRPWLFRVVHRLALKEIRRSRVRDVSRAGDETECEGFEIADSRPTPAEQLLQDEREYRLMRALESLPVRERRCLSLRAEGLRYREIADVLDVSVATVSDVLRRAVTALREVCYE